MLDTSALDVREFCDPATRPDNVDKCTYTLFSVVCQLSPSSANSFKRCSLDFGSESSCACKSVTVLFRCVIEESSVPATTGASIAE